MRFSARYALAVIGLFAALPAHAQFLCTTTPADITCSNTGTAGSVFNNVAAGANQNATTTNAGSAAAFTSFTSGGGSATATNIGFNAAGSNGIVAATVAGGNATALNGGSNSGGANGIVVQTNGGAGGNATATNNGSNNGASNGIVAQTFNGGTATAINNGSNSSGGNGIAVQTFVGDAVAINNGSNAAGGFALIAFTNTTGNVTVINAGTSTSLGGIIGQTTTGGNVTVLNSGTNISTGGISATTLGGGNVTVINSGTNISVNGIVAATFTSGNVTVMNSGTNTGGMTVAATGGNAIVINSGSTTGTVAVQATGGSEILTNSGVISNFGGQAIAFAGGPDTLNLQAGSTIIGGISLVGANDTVNFLSGNHNLTFNTLAGASVNGPDPFAVSGNRAAAIDPTPFGLADKVLMDFTRSISGMLEGVSGGAGASGPISSAFAPGDSIADRLDGAFAGNPALAYTADAMVFKAPTMVTSDGRAAWARGFGGQRFQDADGFLLGSRTTYLGGAVGLDLLARPDLRLGLFAGGGESRMSLDMNLGATNTDTAFGGLYGRWGFVSFGRASFLDFALHGGGSGNSTSRTVNNNTLPGGIEIATARYGSGYISPELKYGVILPLGSQYTLTPSLRVRYVAGFFGGYIETGTTAPLTVASRTINDVEERGELKLTRATPVGPDLLLTSVHVGAIGLERAGDTTVNTVLLGASLPFVTPGKNDVAGVVGGGGFEWRAREGISLFGAGEAIGFSDQSTVWSARGGVRLAF